jgi:hypothetical protein
MNTRTCPKCQSEIIYKNYKSYHSAKTRNSVCKSCRTRIANASEKRNSKMENNPAWKGYKEIPYTWFSKYFERKGRKKTGNVKIVEIYELWIKQNKKCVLSGLDVDFTKTEKGISASIDRIDSNGDYILENVQIVHKDVNLMKNSFPQEYFIELCKKISDGKYRKQREGEV